MNEFERRLKEHAAALPYPPTPTIHWKRPRRFTTRKRQMLRVALVGALLVLALPLYAALERLHIGAIQITIDDPATLDAPLLQLTTLPGAVDLAAARQRFPHPLLLPAALPAPDQVFIQAADQVVILAWLSADHSQVEWLLYQIATENGYGYKLVPELTETTVNDQAAVWLDQPHVVFFGDSGGIAQTYGHLVEGGVLVWEVGGVTYRLETTADLEAVRTVAESLR